MNAALQWQEKPVAVRFSKRKTIALHVKNGDIEIRAPHHTSLAFAQQFLNSRSDWLQQALQEQALKQQDKIDYRFAHRIPFMGIDVPLIRRKDSHSQWQLAEQGLVCSLRNPESGSEILDLLNDFYQRQARFWLRKKTTERAEQLGLRERLTDVRLRRTKSKWGHCTSQGRIQYNWQIMMAPETVIDYLVSHEVCHLQHLNHSEAFWQLVASIHPSYKQDKDWLNEHGHRLSID